MLLAMAVAGAQAGSACWWTEVEMMSREYLDHEEAELAALEMRAPVPAMPVGVVYMTLFAPSIDPASTRFLSLIVVDSTGAEIVWLRGPDETADVPQTWRRRQAGPVVFPMGGAHPGGDGLPREAHVVNAVRQDKCVMRFDAAGNGKQAWRDSIAALQQTIPQCPR